MGLGVEHLRPWPGLLAASLLASCSPRSSIVVGVQSEPMGGAIARLHVVVKVGGVVARDETLRPSERAPLTFPRPWEARVTSRDDGAPVEVIVDGFDAVAAGKPILERRASTHFVKGREALLRVGLEARCIVYPLAPRAPGSAPGPLTGPTCEAPATCVRGVCRSDMVPEDRLEPYTPAWAREAPDLCRPRDAGPPSVTVGTGQATYARLEDGQELRAQPGPQGGHHLWIAVRAENVSQRGSVTTITGVDPRTGVHIAPSVFTFPFNPRGDGACELDGLRYQLDNEGIDFRQFLGEPLDVTATVVDPSGARASASARVTVARELLPP